MPKIINFRHCWTLFHFQHCCTSTLLIAHCWKWKCSTVPKIDDFWHCWTISLFSALMYFGIVEHPSKGITTMPKYNSAKNKLIVQQCRKSSNFGTLEHLFIFSTVVLRPVVLSTMNQSEPRWERELSKYIIMIYFFSSLSWIWLVNTVFFWLLTSGNTRFSKGCYVSLFQIWSLHEFHFRVFF